MNIPLTFSACTEQHEQLINFQLPPLSQKLYTWMMRRMIPGKSQEFDFTDFNNYTMKVGGRTFSAKWFVKCLRLLEGTGLIEILRQYRGFGFKVIARHPWQLERYQNKDTNKFSQSEKSTNNLNSENGNKSSQKATSNADDSVPSYIYNQRKTNNLEEEENVVVLKNLQNKEVEEKLQPEGDDENSKIKSSISEILKRMKERAEANLKSKSSADFDENINKNTDNKIAAKQERSGRSGQPERSKQEQPKQEEKQPQQPKQSDPEKKQVNSVNTVNKRSSNRSSEKVEQPKQQQPQQENQKPKAKAKPKPKLKSEQQSEQPREVEKPIINADRVERVIREELSDRDKEFLRQLEDLGAIANETILNLIQKTDPAKIKRSIGYIREQRRVRYIKNVGGYFVQCIKGDWGAGIKAVNMEQVKEEDLPALFAQWYHLAQKLGVATRKKLVDGEYWAEMSGQWEKWKDAIKRGYTFEYLQKKLDYYVKNYGNQP